MTLSNNSLIYPSICKGNLILQNISSHLNKLEELSLLKQNRSFDYIQGPHSYLYPMDWTVGHKINKIIDEITNILRELLKECPLITNLALSHRSFTIDKFNEKGPITVRPKLFHYFKKEGKMVKELIYRILNRLTLEDLLLYSLSLPIDTKDLRISESPDKIRISVTLFRLLNIPFTGLTNKTQEMNISILDNSYPRILHYFNDMTNSDFLISKMMRLSITLILPKLSSNSTRSKNSVFNASLFRESKKGKNLQTYKIETKLNIKSHKKDSKKYINILTHTITKEFKDDNFIENIIQPKHLNKKIKNRY